MFDVADGGCAPALEKSAHEASSEGALATQCEERVTGVQNAGTGDAVIMNSGTAARLATCERLHKAMTPSNRLPAASGAQIASRGEAPPFNGRQCATDRVDSSFRRPLRSFRSDSMTAVEANPRPASFPSIKAVASAGVGKANRVRVFLVDGDSHCRAALAAVLMKQGFDVESFDEGEALHHSLERHARRQALPGDDITCGKLIISYAQRRAWWDGAVVPLTAGEFDIVALLVSKAGQYMDNRAIYDCLRYKGFLSGHGERGFWVNVRSAIRRLRKKFRDLDSSFAEIETARAFGYCWRKPS